LESRPASPLLITNESIDLSSVGFDGLSGKRFALAYSRGSRKMETQAFTFAASRFVPVAVGFFGLGTGYFIWGGQALFGFPKASPEVNRTMGMWGFWMPGFMQFITGVYLLIGLTWFDVFGNVAPLYMAGLAFTAYGIHWFAMAHRRYIEASAEPDGWMAIAFLFIRYLRPTAVSGEAMNHLSE
jgi:hypothetical protein